MYQIYLYAIFLKLLFGKISLHPFQLNKTCDDDVLTKYIQNISHPVVNQSRIDFYVQNFDRYTDIQIKCGSRIKSNSVSIYLIPKHFILLDETLRLEETFISDASLEIFFVKVKGLSFHQESRAPFFSCCLHFLMSSLDIYLNGYSITRDQCSARTFQNLTSFIQPYWSLSFRFVLFPEQGLCKWIFKSSGAVTIQFGRISNSFLLKNRLLFIGANETRLTKVRSLSFFMSYESLSSAMLDSYLFSGIQDLLVTEVVSVEWGLLRQFHTLKHIDIVLSTVKDFFHTDSRWLNDLNADVSVNLSDAIDIEINMRNRMTIRFTNVREVNTFFSIYTYPNEDLCLFKNFPHSRLVNPILDTREQIACTCTLKWLQLYYGVYRPFQSETLSFETFRNANIQQAFVRDLRVTFTFCVNEPQIECDFGSRLSKCLFSQVSVHREITDKEVFYQIKFLQYFLLVILQPLFGTIGLINNVLVFVTISNKSKSKLFQDPMYKHMKLNATFNILCCLAMTLSLITTCIDVNAHSPYCSIVYTEYSAQHFKIIVHHFLANVFRTGIFLLLFVFYQ